MVNPLLTVLFDIFLIGSAAAIIGGMVEEYLASRRPSVGAGSYEIDFTHLLQPARPAARRRTTTPRRELRRVA